MVHVTCLQANSVVRSRIIRAGVITGHSPYRVQIGLSKRDVFVEGLYSKFIASVFRYFELP